jgi:hypothetical protein
MLPVPTPATRTSSPPCPPVLPSRTTQDNRCLGRWRSKFPPAKVAYIEHLLQFRPLRLSACQEELRDDDDRDFLLYLVEHRLSITNEDSTLKAFRCKNYKSAYAAADQVDDALRPDIASHRIFCPFSGKVSSFVHALGAVPKTATTVRVIYDHSPQPVHGATPPEALRPCDQLIGPVKAFSAVHSNFVRLLSMSVNFTMFKVCGHLQIEEEGQIVIEPGSALQELFSNLNFAQPLSKCTLSTIQTWYPLRVTYHQAAYKLPGQERAG